ncbi:MAG: Lon protease family protein [Thermodesulfobacteriota bacterium]
MAEKIHPLTPEKLRWRCDPDQFSFKTTGDIPSLDEIIGQARAMHSLDMGLGMKSHGYNIYGLGESGTGKSSIIKAQLEKIAINEETPNDWCYIFNFLDPDIPKALSLPAGMGGNLKVDMEELIVALRRDIPKVFESKDYERHRDEVFEGQQERTKAVLSRMEQRAEEKGFILKRSASGLSVVPAKEGKALSQDEYEALPKEKRAHLEEESKFLQERLSDAIREIRTIEKEAKERISTLDREVVQYVVNPLMNDLLEKYKEYPEVVAYLETVKEDVLERVDDFRPKEELALPIPGIKMGKTEPPVERYSVNLLVNNSETKGAPVVIETNPTYYNLFGRIEHRVQYGVAVTDFSMIKAGSVHKANGGYLVLDALDLLRNIFAYDAIKRMIKNREAKIEDVWEQYRLVSATTLKPEPIPVDIKVVLKGDPFIYYLLYRLDKEYRKLFKVKSDFDNLMERSEENIGKYASFIALQCKEEGLLPFDRTGVARVIEQSSRIAGDQEKLTARFSEITDLVKEASFWAGRSGATTVNGDFVEQAVRERVYRNSRIEDRLRELITEGTFLIETEGGVAGQINGIAILDLGDYSFGKPSRITARTYLGDAGVVNIEREAKMSGRIHNKALMILTSYLGNKFAQKTPMSLSASICFEQLYDEIEGDSATCTEFYALVSSLADLPLNQGIAVTGSMNQLGGVQPVGGINQKIEGFFDVCAAKGLNGKQGVILPATNVRHLMLKTEVVEAVEKGQFHIYPIEHIDEGIEILTGLPAGERQPDGAYPEGSVNDRVSKKLTGLAKTLKAFGRPKAAVKKENKDEGKSG